MTIDEIEKILQNINARLTKLENGGVKASGGEVADDRELDSQYGNPSVRKDPPLWIKDGGESYQGRVFSDCPWAYLIALASFFDWKAGKDDEKGTEDGAKYARYARKDAARARGWAKRIKDGWHKTEAPAAEFDTSDTSDDSLPF